MITALLGAGLFARARAAVSGPLGGAMIVAIVAVVAVGALALGLAWLRGDARRDALAACDTREVEQRLAAETFRRQAIEAALATARDELEMRARQQAEAETELVRLEHEKGLIREKADKLEAAAGRAGAVFRADDGWLSQGRAAAAGGNPTRR